MNRVPTSSPCDHGHIAIIFQRYTVFRIPHSRKRNPGNGLFLLMLSPIMLSPIMLSPIMV